MFKEGMPPVLDPDYAGNENGKNTGKGDLSGDRETDVGSLQAGVMSPEDFVKSILAREGGDPARAEQAADSIRKFWVKQLEDGRITPEQFNEGVYQSAVKMLKKRGEKTGKEEAREEAHKARMKNVLGRRAA